MTHNREVIEYHKANIYHHANTAYGRLVRARERLNDLWLPGAEDPDDMVDGITAAGIVADIRNAIDAAEADLSRVMKDTQPSRAPADKI